jgi:GNAT superfamily N-acetyltransferase
VALDIRRISAAETRLLRQAILRPHQRAEELVFPGDEDPDSLHVGVFSDGELIGVASVMRGPMSGRAPCEAWQLRGMAIQPEHRRRGRGAALVRACIDYIARKGCEILWCRARTPAVPFYRALGFETEGEEFEIPVSGPHYVMWRRVPPSASQGRESRKPSSRNAEREA